jgi:hypothetical protein
LREQMLANEYFLKGGDTIAANLGAIRGGEI